MLSHGKETSEDSIVLPPHSLRFTVIDLALGFPIRCNESKIGVNQAFASPPGVNQRFRSKIIEVHQVQKIATLDIATDEAKSADALTVSLT